MAAANPPERFLSPDEFRRVLDRFRGLVVADAHVGKPFDEVLLGQEHCIEVQEGRSRWVEETCFDCEISVVAPWKLTKHGRAVSQSNMMFTFSIGPFKRYPSLDSLHQVAVLDIAAGPQMELVVHFADEQKLSVHGLRLDKNGDAYANWLLKTPGMLYSPAAGGKIRASPYGNVRFV